MRFLKALACAALLAGCSKTPAPQGSFEKTERGVIVTPAEAAEGQSRRVRLEVRNDRIVRVTSVVDAKNLEVPKSLMVVDSTMSPATFKVERRGDEVVLETSRLVAHVSLANGAVRATDNAGRELI